MGNKALTAIIAVILVVLLYMGTTGASLDEIFDGLGDSTEPQSIIDVRITEVNSDSGISGSVDSDSESTLLESNVVTMTAYSTDIIGVIPDLAYELEFVIHINAVLPVTAPLDTELITDVSIFGRNVNYFSAAVPPADAIFLQGTDPMRDANNEFIGAVPDILNIPTSPPGYEAVAEFTKASGRQFDAVYYPVVMYPLLGEYLDGSVWEIVITTRTQYAGTDAFYNQQTVTITLNVDNTGNVEIAVTDVDFIAGEL